MSLRSERSTAAGEGRPGAGATREAVRQRLLRAAQGLTGAWLLIVPLIAHTESTVVQVKDLLAGTVLIALTLTATVSRRSRRWEAPTCLVAGTTLVVAAAVLAFGPGVGAAARQWSDAIAGVVLVCLWSARTS